jgi:hypothetical protein
MRRVPLAQRQAIRRLRDTFDAVLNEPCDEFEVFLRGLPDCSDGSSGAGDVTEGGLTGSGSVYSALSGGSLSIPDADAQSHNLNAPLSTHWNRGGSVKC